MEGRKKKKEEKYFGGFHLDCAGSSLFAYQEQNEQYNLMEVGGSTAIYIVRAVKRGEAAVNG